MIDTMEALAAVPVGRVIRVADRDYKRVEPGWWSKADSDRRVLRDSHFSGWVAQQDGVRLLSDLPPEPGQVYIDSDSYLLIVSAVKDQWLTCGFSQQWAYIDFGTSTVETIRGLELMEPQPPQAPALQTLARLYAEENEKATFATLEAKRLFEMATKSMAVTKALGDALRPLLAEGGGEELTLNLPDAVDRTPIEVNDWVQVREGAKSATGAAVSVRCIGEQGQVLRFTTRGSARVLFKGHLGGVEQNIAVEFLTKVPPKDFEAGDTVLIANPAFTGSGGLVQEKFYGQTVTVNRSYSVANNEWSVKHPDGTDNYLHAMYMTKV